jgi:hypothetical protein
MLGAMLIQKSKAAVGKIAQLGGQSPSFVVDAMHQLWHKNCIPIRIPPIFSTTIEPGET